MSVDPSFYSNTSEGINDSTENVEYSVIYIPDQFTGSNSKHATNEEKALWPQYKLTKKQLSHSKLLLSMTEDIDTSELYILQSSMKFHSLNSIIEYLRHHDGKPITIPEYPLKSKELKDHWTDPWDCDFVQYVYESGTECQYLYDLIMAANYINCDPLVHLVGSKIASIIKSTKLEEFDMILGQDSYSNKE